MIKINVHEKKVICSNPTSPFRYFAWPTVKRLPDGTLAMVCSGFRLKHVCPFGKVIMMYSRDEGKSWTAPAIVMDTPLDDRDAGLATFGDGKVMLTSFNNSVATQRQWNKVTSGEHKWQTENKKNLSEAYLKVVEEWDGAEADYLGSTYRISDDGGYNFGPIGRMPVSAPHGPCELSDGTLLYVGRRFIDKSMSIDPDEPIIQCWKVWSDGRHEMLSKISNIYRDGKLLASCEPHAIQLPDGKIIVHIRVQTVNGDAAALSLYQCESTDGGYTFSEPHQVFGDFDGAPAHFCLMSNGTLLCACGHRSKPYGVQLLMSKDGAESWETGIILDDEGPTHDLGYPATVELNDGKFLTVYYEKRYDQSVIIQKIWSYEEI